MTLKEGMGQELSTELVEAVQEETLLFLKDLVLSLPSS